MEKLISRLPLGKKNVRCNTNKLDNWVNDSVKNDSCHADKWENSGNVDKWDNWENSCNLAKLVVGWFGINAV